MISNHDLSALLELPALSRKERKIADRLEKNIDVLIEKFGRFEGYIPTVFSFKFQRTPVQLKIVLEYLEKKYLKGWKGGVSITQIESIIHVKLRQ